MEILFRHLYNRLSISQILLPFLRSRPRINLRFVCIKSRLPPLEAESDRWNSFSSPCSKIARRSLETKVKPPSTDGISSER
jgi:hypothetical protein